MLATGVEEEERRATRWLPIRCVASGPSSTQAGSDGGGVEDKARLPPAPCCGAWVVRPSLAHLSQGPLLSGSVVGEEQGPFGSDALGRAHRAPPVPLQSLTLSGQALAEEAGVPADFAASALRLLGCFAFPAMDQAATTPPPASAGGLALAGRERRSGVLQSEVVQPQNRCSSAGRPRPGAGLQLLQSDRRFFFSLFPEDRPRLSYGDLPSLIPRSCQALACCFMQLQ